MRAVVTLGAAVAIGVMSPAALADDASAGTAAIDAALEALWADAGITPAASASDAEFLRRVTLDIAGRIPTPGEAEAFLDDTSADKRAALVDRLLAGEDYADHWGDIYSDLFVGRRLRLRPRVQRMAGDYFERAIADNKPYDRLATELLTATGSVSDNPAGSFLALERLRGGNLEQSAGRTARLFLGISIQCAQCHDHPYDQRISQATFTEFAAFFGRTRIRRQLVDGAPALWLEDFNGVLNERQRRRLRRRVDKRPQLRYALEQPRFFGRDVDIPSGSSRRAALAETIVASDLFAKVTVNRVWAQLFGNPIQAPWDDLGYFESPDHSPVLTAVADDFRESGHNHRRLIKAIVLSKAYGRTSRGSGSGEDQQREKLFAKAIVRPLSADQLFASELVATGLETAAKRMLRRQFVNRRKQLALREYLFTFADDEAKEADSFTGSVAQALLLLNGAITNIGAKAADNMVLGRILGASADMAQRVEWMFLSCYARRPTEAESAQYTEFLRGKADARSAYEDLFFAMLTSNEFITNH